MAEMVSRADPYPEETLEDRLREVAACEADPPVRPVVPHSVPSAVRPLMDIQSIGLSLFARRADQAKQARVLHDVFPPHIANMLKRGEKVKPEERKDVTLYFSDIVGFTNISATLSPAKVSDMLDRLYTKLDALADKYELFKVETIGDAYFCAANLVSAQPRHVELAAQFALEAITAAENTLIDMDLPSRGCIRMRVGLHTGDVVTNVVGTKNPRYCLFGDAVNTTARMESNSIAGNIHMSGDTALRLKGMADSE